MKTACSLRIRGRVQGVAFRWHTREKALELGVTGFVQNRLDGSVYAEGEGDQDAVAQWVKWCHTGPGAARVDQVTLEEMPLAGRSDFTIRETV